MNLSTQRAAVGKAVPEHVVDCVVVLEHIGVRQHGRSDIMKCDSVDVRHVVQLGEVVGSPPFGPPVRVSLR